MAASAWKGFINFGLVSIPVRLYPAARKENIRLHQIHAKCHTRLRRPLFCPTCDRIVERSEVVKGYEYAKNQYVLVKPDEIRKIAPPSSKSMEIMEFVPFKDVDPLYFNASYFVSPEESGQKPYRLLLRGMEDTGRAAIAKVTMHEREYLVMLRPRSKGLALHTLYFENEIRYASEYNDSGSARLKAQEISLAQQLIASLEAPFEPAKYRDEYQERLREFLEAKQEGKEIVEEAKPRLAPVVDMMEALKKSLAARSRKPVRAIKVKSKTAHRKAS
ncbi:MAG TPA: Ku protein [Terriglobia bacterium]|nr:Ku protein [Terriglobia bacterium]